MRDRRVSKKQHRSGTRRRQRLGLPESGNCPRSARLNGARLANHKSPRAEPRTHCYLLDQKGRCSPVVASNMTSSSWLRALMKLAAPCCSGCFSRVSRVQQGIPSAKGHDSTQHQPDIVNSRNLFFIQSHFCDQTHQDTRRQSCHERQPKAAKPRLTHPATPSSSRCASAPQQTSRSPGSPRPGSRA